MGRKREKSDLSTHRLARLLVSNCDEERRGEAARRVGVARKRARELAHLRAC